MYRELTPQQWIDEIDSGLEYRRKFGVEDLWGAFEAIYYNVHESMMNDGPNIFLSQGDTMLSTITVPEPRVRVKPTKPEEVQTSPLVELLDNQLFRELNVAREVDIAALHTYLFGRGVLKVGYDSEWGYDRSQDIGGVLQLGLTLSQFNKSGSRRIEYDSTIAPGSPWVRAVMPHDIVVPWGVMDLESSPCVMHRVVRHIDDLRADPKYENTRNLQPTMSMQDFVDSYRSLARSGSRNMTNQSKSRSVDYVEMWEIHDRRTGKIKVVCRDHDKFLRNETNALQIENTLPFVSMTFTPRTRAFWTTPDVYYIYFIQAELSDVARQRTKQRRISTLKFLYDSNVLSEAELAKILSPDVGAAAKVEAGGDISRGIIKIDNEPSQALAMEEELLRANAREQIGFSRNQLGEYARGRKSATEAATVDRHSALRMTRRGLAVRRLYTDLVRVMNNIVFTYWSVPRYVQVMGPELTERWTAVNGPQLRGRYAYEVDLVDASEMTQRRMEALNLYGLLTQDPSIDPIELRSYLANQINDPSFERLFNASVRSQMSQVRTGGGAVRSQSGGPRPSGVSGVQGLNGTVGQPPSSGLLAGRGDNP